MAEPFILGCNYWPRTKAMYWWRGFDAAEVREEFAIIRDLGLKVVRIFLLWDDFQPTPDTVSEDCLTNLRTVCDLAAQHGLGLDVTFFTGHMSGPNWSPRWLLEPGIPFPSPYPRQIVSQGEIVAPGIGYRNPYTDPQALDAQRLLLSTVVGWLKDHPAVWMWNLGNEPDLFAHPPTSDIGRAWVTEMTGLIHEQDPRPVTCGLHIASLLQDNGLRIDKVYGETEVAVMHSYPMYLSWAKHNLDPDLVPYTCALTSALCGKPTLMEEFGGCTTPPGEDSQTWEWTAYGQPRKQFMASEEALANYLEQVLPKLVEVGATGAMVWCFADYTPDLWEKPPCKESKHERFFGLVRPDGSLKPHARVMAEFASSNPVVQPATRTVALDVTPDEYYQAPAEHAVRLYQHYLG